MLAPWLSFHPCGFEDAPCLLGLWTIFISNAGLEFRLVWVDNSEAQCKHALKASAVRLLVRAREVRIGTPWFVIADSFLWIVPQYHLPTRNCYLHPTCYCAHTSRSMLTCCKHAMCQILSLPPSQPAFRSLVSLQISRGADR